MQWLTEEAFGVALELHEAAQLERADDDDDRQSAVARSLERLAHVKRMGG